jgi:hypothetical protein
MRGHRTDDAADWLSLRIEPTTMALRRKQSPRITARITNNGARPVTLVLPGDGSRMGRRTPVIEWIFSPGGRVVGFEACGNVNELKRGEVFTLQPGDAQDLGSWVEPLALPQQRRFHGLMIYRNEPDLTFQGVLLRPHDEGELARLRASDRCRIQSNEVEFFVEDDGAP